MNPFHELSEENHANIRKYLRFFRQKKEACVRAIKNEFSDAKADKLDDSMLSREEVIELIDFLQSSVQVQVESDIGSIVNMGALALNQLLESAQEKDVELTLDTSKVENARLLEEVEKMSLDAIPKHQRRGVGALTSLKDEAKVLRDTTDRLQEEKKQLLDRFGNVQQEASTLAKERNMIQHELDDVKSRLQVAEGRVGQREEADNKQDSEIREQIHRLERSLENALEESTRRVSETAQFKQMKQMMQNQSKKLVDLKKRLNKYEPEDSKDDEDD